MAITVNLISRKKGEIKKFWEELETYHQVDEDVVEWIYIFSKPEDAVGIINEVLKRKGNFEVSLWVQVGDEDLISVDKYNREKVVKGIYSYLNQNAGLEIE